MSLHDRYARVTPVEIALPDAEARADLFRRIAEEAGGGGADPADLATFMQLDTVGAALRALRAPEVGGEAIHRYAVLLHQAFLFERAGSAVLLPVTGVVRYLVDGAPRVEGGLVPPADAGYVQLPQHLVWVGGAGAGSEAPDPDDGRRAGHPESVDGMFWSLGPAGTLHLLLALGVRGDRAGLSVVPVAEAPWADAAGWLDASVRPGGDDFVTTLPGAEFDGLYSFQAAGEPLKLFARLCAYLAAFPDAVRREEPRDAPDGDGPSPSVYPYRRITLEGNRRAS